MNSSSTTIPVPPQTNLGSLPSGNWGEDFLPQSLWTSLISWREALAVRSSASSGTDLWGDDLYARVVTWTLDFCIRPTLQDLGWTQAEVIETRMRLKSFEEDWEFPGMEAYDEL